MILRPCPGPVTRTPSACDYGFLHLAAASALRWWTGQFPYRKMGALRLPPDRIAVAAERCMEYTALSIGCNARLALLTALGVTARLTARPGCMARRTLRGSNLEKKPTLYPQATRRPCPKTTLASYACSCIRQTRAARQTRLSAVAEPADRIRLRPAFDPIQSWPSSPAEPEAPTDRDRPWRGHPSAAERDCGGVSPSWCQRETRSYMPQTAQPQQQAPGPRHERELPRASRQIVLRVLPEDHRAIATLEGLVEGGNAQVAFLKVLKVGRNICGPC
jgi:hypothetical protein